MKRGFTLLEVMLALAIFALAATAVLQIASGALSNQQILEEKTVAGWVAENQTALLYLMTREQRAVRQQGESDMAGSRWYWRTTPLSTGNALLQAVDIEVSLHEDFSSVIQSRRAWFSAVAGHDQKLNLMQQTMSFLTHDLTQMMPRPVRGDQGQREPALLAGAGVLASESEGMRFVRGGVINPLMRLPRSNLLTVGYRIHDGYLERLAWPLTDAAGSVKPTMQKLIPADSLRLQFYDGTRWQESWSSVQAIPVAVRMTLHSPQWGEIERIWLLRGPQ